MNMLRRFSDDTKLGGTVNIEEDQNIFQKELDVPED